MEKSETLFVYLLCVQFQLDSIKCPDKIQNREKYPQRLLQNQLTD